MLSIITLAGCASASIGSEVSMLDLLTVVSSQTCQFLYIGDLGFSSAAGTTTWTDQSGNSRNLTIADANAPTQVSYPVINSKNAITFSAASSQRIESVAFNRSAGWWFLFVFMPTSWVTGATLMDSQGSASKMRVCQNPTATPNMRLQDTGNGPTNTNGANNAWKRARVLFGTSAEFRLGNLEVNGSTTAATPNIGVRFGGSGGGSIVYGNFALACAAAFTAKPAEQSAIDSLITSYYGADVGVG